MALYDLTLEFYQTLKTAQNKLGDGVALANTDVAYLLGNAGWHVTPNYLDELIGWYEIMGLPPAVIVSREDDRDILKDRGFTLERSFAFRTPESSSSKAQVEQVSWSQMRYAGQLLAQHYEQPENALAIGKSLTKAMQANEGIRSFLAYEDEATGVMVTFETARHLVSMLSVDGDGSLENRLVQEARSLGLEPLILEALPEGVGVVGELGLERWSIR